MVSDQSITSGVQASSYAGLLLAAVMLFLSGCAPWPAEGRGGLAEYTEPEPDCVELHSGAAYASLDQRLGCANRRFETLQRVGAKLHAPALVMRADAQSQRVIRELTGGLYEDARIDLEIYSALLDEIERRLMAATVAGLDQGEETSAEADSEALAALVERLNHSAFYVTGSARPNPLLVSLLRQAAKQLTLVPEVEIRVTGHTDDRGDMAYNQTLGLERAAAIRQELIALGVAEQRVCAGSGGAASPAFDNISAEARLVNRRVVFAIGGCGLQERLASSHR